MTIAVDAGPSTRETRVDVRTDRGTFPATLQLPVEELIKPAMLSCSDFEATKVRIGPVLAVPLLCCSAARPLNTHHASHPPSLLPGALLVIVLGMAFREHLRVSTRARPPSPFQMASKAYPNGWRRH